jgi:hypothetical protein
MRIRHYSHLNENRKPQFIYHRNETSYVEKVLREQSSTVTKQPKPIDHSDHNNHDLKKPDSVLKSRTMEPPPGFEPGIFSLQG